VNRCSRGRQGSCFGRIHEWQHDDDHYDDDTEEHDDSRSQASVAKCQSHGDSPLRGRAARPCAERRPVFFLVALKPSPGCLFGGPKALTAGCFLAALKPSQPGAMRAQSDRLIDVQSTERQVARPTLSPQQQHGGSDSEARCQGTARPGGGIAVHVAAVHLGRRPFAILSVLQFLARPKHELRAV